MKYYLESIENAIDRFFIWQERLFWSGLECLFEYVYRETHAGVFGLFANPEQILHAAKQARERGYTGFDCLTPFAVHGLEGAMGLGRSRIPYITFVAASIGLGVGVLLQTLVHEQIISGSFFYFDALPNLRSYPLNIGGKPTFSWPAMVPIAFELTVLLGGHATVAGLIVLSRLYRPFRKVLHPDITNDKFCLWLPSTSKGYSQEEAVQFLKELKATEITLVTSKAQHPLSDVQSAHLASNPGTGGAAQRHTEGGVSASTSIKNAEEAKDNHQNDHKVSGEG